MSDERAKRIARMEQELLDVGLSLPAGELGGVLLDELVSARYVHVHEGIRPTYGAIIRAGGLEDVETKVPREGVAAADVRALADGISTFVVRDLTNPQGLAIVMTQLEDEIDAVSLAMSQQAVIVQRHDAGTITVVFPEEIWVNELFTWRRRPIARQRAIDLRLGLRLHGDTFELVVTLVEFAVHQLSPRGIGATLVIPVRPGGPYSAEGYRQGAEPPFHLSAMSPDDRNMLRTFLRVVDGACVFGPDGAVTQTQVKLKASDDATALLRTEGGSRHASAQWFSYDYPEYVVLVVSADGPVSLFSDGRKFAQLSSTATPERPDPVQVVPGQRDKLDTRTADLTCDTCKATLELREFGQDTETAAVVVACEVCGADLLTTAASFHELIVKKPWW
ncbi:DNA integrity scanning protein DisA with diadenylate cyclase activity [Microbacterium sp. BE35]|uniref:diadenylate cyclase n=1 Tax=Microbacterium sp. BE35 TaxID=2817773 RepID=UPI00285770EF|nr:diadenylate cyclase [Microbacterium sp. BE35]MDR7188138.1 DNA integrity scanning protein DisA with diadenylate cyclase activity [Microbacterium sp. BE35]